MAKFKIKLLAFIIFILLNIIYITCKKRFYGNLPTKPSVILFWHGKLAMMAFLFAYAKKNGYNKVPHVLISTHKDGELISSVMEFFKIKSVRGSTYDSAVKALINIKKVIKQGDDVCITPDGPRGPFHSISAGSYKIATKNNLPIVLIDNTANKFYQAKSWDKMILAKPFSTISYIISEPIFVTDDNACDIIQSKFEELEAKLKENEKYA